MKPYLDIYIAYVCIDTREFYNLKKDTSILY